MAGLSLYRHIKDIEGLHNGLNCSYKKSKSLIARKFILRWLFFVVILWNPAGWAVEQVIEFSIPPSNADTAMNLLANQADVQLMYPYSIAKNVKVKGLSGAYTVRGGVEQLLQGTCLGIAFNADRSRHNNETSGIAIMEKLDCRKRGLIAGLSAAIIGAFSSSGGLAQDLNASERQVTGIEEIVVTARRREEGAQSVPVSMTTLSDQLLVEKGFKDIRELTNLSPGLRVVSNGGGNTADITLRGMRRYGFGESTPAVVPYFAEVPMQSEGALFSTMDLENIQVLKGPQGTLFGRNTLAGAILVSPKEPVHGYEGYLKGGVGDYGYKLTEGAINIPLVENTVALRMAGQVEKRDGYIENIGIGSDWNDIDYQSYRMSLLIEPNDFLRNLTIYDYYEKNSAGSSAVPVENLQSGVSALVTSILSPQCGTAIADKTVCNYSDAFNTQQARGVYKVKLNVAPIAEQTLWGLTNKTDFNFNDITVRNIFGYREVENYTQLDADGLTLAIPVLSAWGASDVSQISNEFQVLGDALDNRMDWIVGAFYLKSEPEGNNAGRSDVISQGAWIGRFYERENEALFGQVGYNITEEIKLNIGYRITWEEASVCSNRESLPSRSKPISDYSDCRNSPLAINIDKKRESTSTWSLGIDYQVNDEVFIYAVSRRGTREGSINLPDFTGSFFEQFQEFDQEKVTDFEAGIKSDLNVGPMIARVNLSAYTMIREDIQTAVNMSNLVTQYNNNPALFGQPVGSTVPLPDQGSLIINGGETRVDGVDAEIVLMPLDSLTVSVLAAYSNTSVSKQVPSPFPGYVNTPNLLSPSPKWSSTVSIRYQKPIESIDSELVVNATYFWTDDVLFGNDYIAPSYDVTDLRVQLNNILGSRFGAGAFANNMFDNEYYESSAAAASSLGFYTVNIGAPRMIGIEVNYQF